MRVSSGLATMWPLPHLIAPEREGRGEGTATPVRMTEHAEGRASARGIDPAVVLEVAERPEQTVSIRPGREVRQARVPHGPQTKGYLIRVVVDVHDDIVEVVTVYRTSRIDKYWMR